MYVCNKYGIYYLFIGDPKLDKQRVDAGEPKDSAAA